MDRDGRPERSGRSADAGVATGSFGGVALLLGPAAAAALLLFVDLDPANPLVTRTAAVALLMAIWWITEAIPLGITALLPMVLFPALGVMDGAVVAPLYFNHVIFLFIGGFLVAIAMQRWGLHRRIALRVLVWAGPRPRRILLGFIAATGFLSMWISNSAAAMMMVPIAIAIALELEERLGAAAGRRFAIGVLLGVAYGASVGGIATLVGTPPNLSFARIFAITFPRAPEISFANWFFLGLPLSVVFLAVTWAWLAARFCPREALVLDAGSIRRQHAALGPMSFAEKVVLADFVLLVVFWLFRADIDLGAFRLPGWSRLFGRPDYLNDGTVAIALALPLFMVPARAGRGSRVLDWEAARGLPWGLILLFGGGFALASAFKESGLSLWLGGRLAGWADLHPVLLVATVALLLTLLTELTSNLATAEMLLPVIAGMAVQARIHPLLLMVPATLACSCAFMLPVATPPNAIVFGSERIRIRDMVRAGLLLNMVGVVLITAAVFTVARLALNIDPTTFPAWARR